MDIIMGKEQERADLHRTIWTINMKKLVAIVMFCFAVLFANAQSQHLKFMGISMEKTKNSFVWQLEMKGFNVFEEKASTIWMEGVFAGENVILEIDKNPKMRKVCSVLVKFDEKSGYTFESLTSKLIEKYGYDVMTLDYPFIKNEKEHVAWIVDKDEQGIGNIIALCENTDGKLYVMYLDTENHDQNVKESLNDF